MVNVLLPLMPKKKADNQFFRINWQIFGFVVSFSPHLIIFFLSDVLHAVYFMIIPQSRAMMKCNGQTNFFLSWNVAQFEKNEFSSPQATNSTVSSIFEAHRTIEMKVKKELFNIRNQPYFTHHFFTSQSCNDVRK